MSEAIWGRHRWERRVTSPSPFLSLKTLALALQITSIAELHLHPRPYRIPPGTRSVLMWDLEGWRCFSGDTDHNVAVARFSSARFVFQPDGTVEMGIDVNVAAHAAWNEEQQASRAHREIALEAAARLGLVTVAPEHRVSRILNESQLAGIPGRPVQFWPPVTGVPDPEWAGTNAWRPYSVMPSSDTAGPGTSKRALGGALYD